MTTIEKAARALHNHIHHDCEYAVVGIFAQKLWQDRARAVLMALREPNHAMIDAGDIALSKAGLDNVECGDSKPAWQAMMDAALNDV